MRRFWHLHEILKADKDVLDGKPVHRVEFHEITKTAIQHAIQQPRELSLNLGYRAIAPRARLSSGRLQPVARLWKKVRCGPGRRLSKPGVVLIVEREEEIAKFVLRE